LIDVSGGIPFLITLAVLPEGASEIVNGEEQFLCAPLVYGAEHSIMAYESLKLAA
jgi:hypothetical protein